jgi:hypothetical protein
MGMFKLDFLFDEQMFDRVIVTYDKKANKWTASIRIIGGGDGYGVYSSGINPKVAIDRAIECLDKPERWRKLKF